MDERIKVYDEKMTKTYNNLLAEFGTIRAGRANPAVLDKITVDYYGSPTQINAMAAVSVSEARILVIQPWDISSLKSIEKAIMASDIGITPTNDGKVIRLAFPQLTEERRKELSKQIRKMGEDAKVAERNIRRDALEQLKKLKNDKTLSEDEYASCEKDVEKAVSDAIAEIDTAVSAKEKEIMTV